MPDDLTRRPLAIALAAHRDESDGLLADAIGTLENGAPRSSHALGDGAVLPLRFVLEALKQRVGIETSRLDGAGAARQRELDRRRIQAGATS
jgi:hypothetical protein